MDIFIVVLIILIIILFILIFLKINEKSLFNTTNNTANNTANNTTNNKISEIPKGTKYEQKKKLPEGWDITENIEIQKPSFILGGIDMKF
jgi:predicted PurR-regulated permease PerM